MKRHRKVLLVTLLTGIVIALAMAMNQTRSDPAGTAPVSLAR
jgi:flagellar biosynthesis protein FliQ